VQAPIAQLPPTLLVQAIVYDMTNFTLMGRASRCRKFIEKR